MSKNNILKSDVITSTNIFPPSYLLNKKNEVCLDEYNDEKKNEIIEKVKNIKKPLYKCDSGLVEDILRTLPRVINKNFDNKIVWMLLSCLHEIASKIRGREKIRDVGVCNFLLQLFYLYPDNHHKQIIACLFGLLYHYGDFLPSYVVILETLKNIVKRNIPDSPVTVKDGLYALHYILGYSLSYFIDGGIIPILLDLFDHHDSHIRVKAAHIFQSIYSEVSPLLLNTVSSVLARLVPYVSSYADYFRKGASHSSPMAIEESLDSNTRYFYGYILESAYNMIKIDKSCISHFLSTQSLLDHMVVLLSSSSDCPWRAIIRLVFIDGAPSSYHVELLLEHGMMPVIVSKIVMLKEDVTNDCYRVECYVMLLFFLALEGAVTAGPHGPNRRSGLLKGVVEEELIKMYSSVLVPVKYEFKKKDIKNVQRCISLTLCLIHKGMSLPHHLAIHLEDVHSMLGESAGMWHDVNFTRWSKMAWDGLVSPESSLKRDKEN